MSEIDPTVQIRHNLRDNLIADREEWHRELDNFIDHTLFALGSGKVLDDLPYNVLYHNNGFRLMLTIPMYNSMDVNTTDAETRG